MYRKLNLWKRKIFFVSMLFYSFVDIKQIREEHRLKLRRIAENVKLLKMPAVSARSEEEKKLVFNLR